MLEGYKKEDVLFLDIETVPLESTWGQLSKIAQSLWEKKAKSFRSEESAEQLYEKAGIYAEFGKIVCISVGLFSWREEKLQLRLKSYTNKDEVVLLQEFATMLRKYAAEGNKTLCAHNGKDFDFPYIARRMLIKGIRIPGILDNAGKKPWEIKLIDTMELWKFGDFRHYTSLNLLTHLFDIPSPKDDIDGSQVAKVYYEDDDLERIARYCEKDVLAIAQLFLKWKGEDLIPDDQIFYVDH